MLVVPQQFALVARRRGLRRRAARSIDPKQPAGGGRRGRRLAAPERRRSGPARPEPARGATVRRHGDLTLTMLARAALGRLGRAGLRSSPPGSAMRAVRQAARHDAALGAGVDQPDPPPVDAAGHLPRRARARRLVVQNLSTSPSFFASTTILIIGGLLAVLGTTDKASELVREIPFAARTSVLVFDLKVRAAAGDLRLRLLPLHLEHAPVHLRRAAGGRRPSAPIAAMGEQAAVREAFADRAGRVVGLAAETFNDGLRAYYFALRRHRLVLLALAFVVATGGRDLDPVPARVPLRRAGRAEGLSSGVARQPHTAELPARVGREEVAVAGARMCRRRGAGAAAQHELVAP